MFDKSRQIKITATRTWALFEANKKILFKFLRLLLHLEPELSENERSATVMAAMAPLYRLRVGEGQNWVISLELEPIKIGSDLETPNLEQSIFNSLVLEINLGS